MVDAIVPITCPTCGARVSVPPGSNRFKCDYCGNESLIRIALEPLPAAAPAVRAIHPRVPAPSCVNVENDGKSLYIVQRWYSLKYLPMAFFCVAWDSFLCFWYSMAIGSNAPWIFVVFPIAHLAIGIGLTYSTLAGFLNTTKLELTREKLSIWFEPLPWLGAKDIPTAQLKQLFCKETFSHGKHGTTSHYHLYAVTRDDQEVKLLSKIDSPDVARYFEQQIEAWLRIEDQPVVGEMLR